MERFSNPPIKEAILNIKYGTELSMAQLEEFCSTDYVSESYEATKKNITRQLGSEGERSEHSFSIESLQDGFILQSLKEGEKLIVIRKSHLSYHKINKYESWEKLILDFKGICEELVKVVKSDISISETFVRYINKIPIDKNGRLTDYFKLLPPSIDGVPNRIGNLFLQVSIPSNDLNGIITEAIESPASDPNFVIDLKIINKAPSSINNPEIWEGFERMRVYKNQLFFSIITEKTKSLFV